MLNYIILLGKNFIKGCKFAHTNIDFFHFLVKLKNQIITEEYIYSVNNETDNFNIKWGMLANAL